MRLYSYINIMITGFSNSYIVANEKLNEAILIDPGKITPRIIEKLESKNFKIQGILITHNHETHVQGLRTLNKIYSTNIYAADYEIAETKTVVLNGDGKMRLAGMTITYYSLPGHSADSMIYKIGNMIFTGDAIFAGTLGTTNSSYSKHVLKSNIEAKIFSQTDTTILLPSHGPPTTVKAEKFFNLELS